MRYLRLPSSIGIMLIALLVSGAIILFGNTLFPKETVEFSAFIRNFDFSDILMGAMLNFLLFAGAIHININDLREQKWAVMVFSTIGVLISTFVVGFVLYTALPYFSADLPLMYCLLFGALISPTDPIAVLSILKTTGVSKSLETKFAGESLFNDGVAVVLFAILFSLARGEQIDLTFLNISWLILREAGGAIVLGLALGNVATAMMAKVSEDYKISVLISLSTVMGGYLIAHGLQVSGPLTMVVAGLIVGNKTVKYIPEVSSDYINKFWELIDEILNAILFLIIGFELLIIKTVDHFWGIGLITVFIVLLARYVSIFIPSKIFPKLNINRAASTLLVWGGLRGGVSIALALSLNEGLYKDLILGITYFVVVFSILVQGLTLGKLTQHIKKMALQKKLK